MLHWWCLCCYGGVVWKGCVIVVWLREMVEYIVMLHGSSERGVV